ncbi:MAG: hypothetical protein ACI837_000688 [Crocinitomicaceae bacterium]|jgi:hypothetical protein
MLKRHYQHSLCSVIFLFAAGFTWSQNVGIGTATPAQKLHIDGSAAGMQTLRIDDLMTGQPGNNPPIPKVNLVSVAVDITTGDLVATDLSGWRLDGNANTINAGYTGSCPNLIGTMGANDFIGTSDNQDWIIATNNVERARFLRDGQLVVYTKGTATPISSPTGCIPAYPTIDNASFYGVGAVYPLNAYSETAPAIYGAADTGPGASLTSASGNGVEAFAGALGGSMYGDGINTSQPRWRTAGQNAISSVEGALGSGIICGLRGSARGDGGLAWGGEFTVNDATNGDFMVAVGANWAGTFYKVWDPFGGGGLVSTSREDHTGQNVTLFAPESPMPLYTDYGTGQLENGVASIDLDPAFAHMIYVDEADNAPLRVIVQLEGDCNGVFVTNKTATGFEVRELSGGNSNVKFTYTVTANTKDVVHAEDGYHQHIQSIRFPHALDRPDGREEVNTVTPGKVAPGKVWK